MDTYPIATLETVMNALAVVIAWIAAGLIAARMTGLNRLKDDE